MHVVRKCQDVKLHPDLRHLRVDLLRHSIAAVHQTARHVLAKARVAPDYNGVKLTDRHGDFNHLRLLMAGLLR